MTHTAPRRLLLFLAAVTAWVGCEDTTEPDPEPTCDAVANTSSPITFDVDGFPKALVPSDNPTTPEGVALGRMLFHDPILSGDSTLACAGCHIPSRAFADSTATSDGIDGTFGTRNTPALMNTGWTSELFWDGRAASLEAQAMEPVPNPIEMHLDWPTAEARLNAHPTYPGLFETVFGVCDITSTEITKAIAQFERTFVSHDARFDRFMDDPIGNPFTPSEISGFTIFTNEPSSGGPGIRGGDCFHCHFVNDLFTDNRFHNVGVDSVIIDQGLGAITGRADHIGLFKTPSLRNVELTAPYMHDGRFETLEQVVQHYNQGGHRTPTVDPLIRVDTGLGLSDQEVQDVVAFLKTLTDSSFVTNPAFQSPF